MKTIYDVTYFIKKYQSIPEQKWCIKQLEDKYGNRCALGHLHQPIIDSNFVSKEMQEFVTIGFVIECHSMVDVNNGVNPRYQQPTPKQRILAALYDIYEKTYGRKYGEAETPKEKVIYRTVLIDSAVKTLQTSLTEN